eukprot:3591795-Pyramimonas_sp.AAC.1
MKLPAERGSQRNASQGGRQEKREKKRLFVHKWSRAISEKTAPPGATIFAMQDAAARDPRWHTDLASSL